MHVFAFLHPHKQISFVATLVGIAVVGAMMGEAEVGTAVVGAAVVGAMMGTGEVGATVIGALVVGTLVVGAAVVGTVVVGATVIGVCVVGAVVVGAAVVGDDVVGAEVGGVGNKSGHNAIPNSLVIRSKSFLEAGLLQFVSNISNEFWMRHS